MQAFTLVLALTLIKVFLLFVAPSNPCRCGKCVNTEGSFYCVCDQWSTGKHCQNDIDECSNKTFCSVDISQGFCKNKDASTIPCGQEGYKCFCSNGFQGTPVFRSSACINRELKKLNLIVRL